MLLFMGFRAVAKATLSSFLFIASAYGQTPLPSNEWSRVLKPTPGSAISIGFYASGCISGAHSLEIEGPGFQVMKTLRNRNYGHPDLIDFITRLGSKLDAVNSAVLIGDMGQARGGPLPYGHASHQNGLDVDLWYWTHPDQRVRSLTQTERNTLEMKTVLNANGLVDESKFTSETIAKLKFAATDPHVERIFVNPAIKTYLCSTLPTSELYWLHALRPWVGHDDHFHVRLSCSSDSPNCTHQAAQDAGDGCTEVIPLRRDLKKGVKADHDDEISGNLSPEIEKLIGDSKLNHIPSACTKLLRQ
jgi:penicillin-insensitive murein endopeptidase